MGLSYALMLCAFVLITLLVIYVLNKGSSKLQTRVELLKNVFEVFAIAAAGFYFYYQLTGNPDVANLDIHISTERQPYTQNHDVLVVSVQLKKGSIRAVDLDSIVGRVLVSDSVSVPLKYDGYGRLSLCDRRIEGFDKIDHGKKYTMAINESTHFSTYELVPKMSICKVDIVVLGRSRTLREVTSQWRASTISLPKNK